jgi:hypothetical protein
MEQNSMLASLFGSPLTSGNAARLAGLQTRAGVNALIQSQVRAGGPNAVQLLRENIWGAQSELSKLKDKVLKAGGNSSDMEMWDSSHLERFGGSSQKTKAQTFRQRLEFGINFQLLKNHSLHPPTADIGLSLGYKLNEKSIIGVGVSYKMGMHGAENLNITRQGAGLRSFLDWRIKKQFSLTGGYELNYNSSFKNIQQLQQFNSWQQSGLVGLSKEINGKPKWVKGTKLQLLYDFLAAQHIPITRPVIVRVGYNF